MAGIIARDPLYYNRYGRALPTSAITSGTVDGDTVDLLGLGASYVTFVVTADSVASGATLAIVVQGQRRDTGAWETLKEADGTTNLAFTASKLADGAELETNKYLAGSVEVGRLSKLYKAVRISATESGGAAVDIAAMWHASDLTLNEGGAADDLLEKQRPQVA